MGCPGGAEDDLLLGLRWDVQTPADHIPGERRDLTYEEGHAEPGRTEPITTTLLVSVGGKWLKLNGNNQPLQSISQVPGTTPGAFHSCLTSHNSSVR